MPCRTWHSGALTRSCCFASHVGRSKNLPWTRPHPQLPVRCLVTTHETVPLQLFVAHYRRKECRRRCLPCQIRRNCRSSWCFVLSRGAIAASLMWGACCGSTAQQVLVAWRCAQRTTFRLACCYVGSIEQPYDPGGWRQIPLALPDKHVTLMLSANQCGSNPT